VDWRRLFWSGSLPFLHADIFPKSVISGGTEYALESIGVWVVEGRCMEQQHGFLSFSANFLGKHLKTRGILSAT
jgi:hypothetical protein